MRKIRWSPLVIVVAAASLTVGAGACAGGRISLGTAAGACFRALPPAEQAIHNKGKLVGVRRVRAATFKARLPQDATLATLPDQDLCVFAFSGTYDPGTVAGAQNSKVGHYAVVAVSTKDPDVVAAFVLDNLPTRFAHVR